MKREKNLRQTANLSGERLEKIITFRCSLTDRQRLKQAALEGRESVSDLIRRAIEQDLSSKKKLDTSQVQLPLWEENEDTSETKIE